VRGFQARRRRRARSLMFASATTGGTVHVHRPTYRRRTAHAPSGSTIARNASCCPLRPCSAPPRELSWVPWRSPPASRARRTRRSAAHPARKTPAVRYPMRTRKTPRTTGRRRTLRKDPCRQPRSACARTGRRPARRSGADRRTATATGAMARAGPRPRSFSRSQAVEASGSAAAMCAPREPASAARRFDQRLGGALVCLQRGRVGDRCRPDRARGRRPTSPAC